MVAVLVLLCGMALGVIFMLLFWDQIVPRIQTGSLLRMSGQNWRVVDTEIYPGHPPSALVTLAPREMS